MISPARARSRKRPGRRAGRSRGPRARNSATPSWWASATPLRGIPRSSSRIAAKAPRRNVPLALPVVVGRGPIMSGAWPPPAILSRCAKGLRRPAGFWRNWLQNPGDLTGHYPRRIYHDAECLHCVARAGTWQWMRHRFVEASSARFAGWWRWWKGSSPTARRGPPGCSTRPRRRIGAEFLDGRVLVQQMSAPHWPWRSRAANIEHRAARGIRVRGMETVEASWPWLKAYPPGIDWRARFPEQPLYQFLEESVARFGHRPCLDFLGRSYSYAEIGRLVRRAAKGFAALGPRPRLPWRARGAPLSHDLPRQHRPPAPPSWGLPVRNRPHLRSNVRR